MDTRKASLVWKLVKDVVLVLVTWGRYQPEQPPLTAEEAEQVRTFVARHGTSEKFAETEVRRLAALARVEAQRLRQEQADDAFLKFIAGMFGVVMVVALGLGAIYALVRFVKWAWAD